MAADWAALPWPALKLISDHFTFAGDYIRFRSVCSSWRSSAPERPQLPLLAGYRLVNDGGLHAIFTINFFNGSGILPIAGGPAEALLKSFCIGSSHGRMAFLDRTLSVFLWNPITRSRIQLPPLTHFPDINWRKPLRVQKIGDDFAFFDAETHEKRFVRTFEQSREYLACKLVLSSDPATDPNCAALLIRCGRRRLAYCRLGDAVWTPIIYREFRSFSTDAIFYRGKFYVACRRSIYVCNPGQDPGLERIEVASPPFDEEPELPEVGDCYLVESARDLFLVNVCYSVAVLLSPDSTVVYSCEIYKVDWGGRRVKLLKVRGLGDRALFLGLNESYSVCASRFPGCRTNYIYIDKLMLMGGLGRESLWHPCTWVKPSLLA